MKKIILVLSFVLISFVLIYSNDIYGQSKNLAIDKVVKMYEGKAGVSEIKALLKIGVNAKLKNEVEVVIYEDKSFDYAKNAKTEDGFYLGKYYSISEYSTPLMIASMFGYYEIASSLIENKANINIKGYYDWNALFEAVYNGHSDIVSLLIKNGADVNSIEAEYEWTPLIVASERGYYLAAKTLLENGAYIHAKDRFGGAAVIEAAREGHTDILKLLLDNGALINTTDFKSKTPLISAAENGEIEAVRILLEYGASVFNIDDNKKTAMDYALENCYGEIIFMLKKVQEKQR